VSFVANAMVCLYEKSPRYVTPEIANSIVAKLPLFVTPVRVLQWLCVDADASRRITSDGGSSRWMIQVMVRTESECLAYQRTYMKH